MTTDFMKYLITLILLLAGCGGSSDVSKPAPEPNAAPSVFVYSVTDFFEGDNFSTRFDASDSDQDSLSFVLSGEDADLFNINVSDSTITAAVVFDFEEPLDADQNNVYEFNLVVSDGKVSSLYPISLVVNNIVELEQMNILRDIQQGDVLRYDAQFAGLQSFPTSMSGPGEITIEYQEFNPEGFIETGSEDIALLRVMTFYYDEDKEHILKEAILQRTDGSIDSFQLVQSDSIAYCTNYVDTCVGFRLEPSPLVTGDSIYKEYLHSLITDSDIVRNIYSSTGFYSFDVGSKVVYTVANGQKYEAFEVTFERVFDEPPQAGHIESLSGTVYYSPSIGMLGGTMRLNTYLDVGSRSADITFRLTSTEF